MKRIVIVEDESDLADLIAYNLTRAGYETIVANDGRTGLAKIRESAPDLVVLDVMLPQLSGLDVAREVRTTPRTASTPIIMLTARAPEADLVTLGPVTADLSVHQVTVGGEAIKTTLTEFRLLVALMRAGGKTLSRYDLMSRVMGPGVMVTTRTIDVHVASIRKKLGSASHMIRTIRGVGYRMTDQAEAVEAAGGEDE